MKVWPYLQAPLILAFILGSATTTMGVASSVLLSLHQNKSCELNIKRIAGKSPSVVSKELGPPTLKETIKNKGRLLSKMTYRGGMVEIVFVNGVSDWLTIRGEGRIPYSPEALLSFGLVSRPPDYSNPPYTIRWNYRFGLKELSLFPGLNGYMDYAYILVNSAP
jgi:hypothetical protein